METGDSHDGAAPRRSVEPRHVRPMVPAVEAQARLVEACIELLRENPVSGVTLRRLSEATGLHPTAVGRNFGSMEGLLCFVCKVLTDRVQARLVAVRDMAVFTDPDFALRTKLLAWLIAQGVDPDDFYVQFDAHEVQELVGAFQSEGTDHNPISRQTAAAWVQIATFMLEGYALFRGVHGMNDEEFLQMAALFAAFTERLADLQEDLGWDRDE